MRKDQVGAIDDQCFGTYLNGSRRLAALPGADHPVRNKGAVDCLKICNNRLRYRQLSFTVRLSTHASENGGHDEFHLGIWGAH